MLCSPDQVLSCRKRALPEPARARQVTCMMNASSTSPSLGRGTSAARGVGDPDRRGRVVRLPQIRRQERGAGPRAPAGRDGDPGGPSERPHLGRLRRAHGSQRGSRASRAHRGLPREGELRHRRQGRKGPDRLRDREEPLRRRGRVGEGAARQGRVRSVPRPEAGEGARGARPRSPRTRRTSSRRSRTSRGSGPSSRRRPSPSRTSTPRSPPRASRRRDVDAAKAALQNAELTSDAYIRVAEAEVLRRRRRTSRPPSSTSGYTTIKAPISGMIGKRNVDPGNLVGRGDSTLLATIVEANPILVQLHDPRDRLPPAEEARRDRERGGRAEGRAWRSSSS